MTQHACPVPRVFDGDVWAQNRAEGGARFTFTLPLTQPAAVTDGVA